MSHDLTVASIRYALNLEQTRAQVAAQNIAQMNVPGANVQRVSFSEQVFAVKQLVASEHSGDAAASAHWQALISQPATISSSSNAQTPVSADVEIADLSEASGRYSALAEAMSRHFSLMTLAVTRGR